MLVDVHTHLAWNIDDGMDTQEHAQEALQQARQDGIKKIIATPHFIPGRHTIQDKKRMKKRINDLKKLAQDFGIDIYTGCEIFLNQSYLNMIDDGIFFTLNNSRYILVEFDVRSDINDNESVEDILYELKIREYVPVIAHVERYFHSKLDIARIKGWIDDGCIIQVNRTSLLGIHGSRNVSNAKKILTQGLAHVVASDAHSAEGNRICKLSDCYTKIEQQFGKENANLLCVKNPNHILQDEELESMCAKKGLFERMFKKGV